MIAKSASKQVGLGWIVSILLFAVYAAHCESASAAGPNAVAFGSDAIMEAFVASCDGYSSDELLIRDGLRNLFLISLSKSTGTTIDARAERSALLHLQQLRKAGKLTMRAMRRGNPFDPSVIGTSDDPRLPTPFPKVSRFNYPPDVSPRFSR